MLSGPGDFLAQGGQARSQITENSNTARNHSSFVQTNTVTLRLAFYILDVVKVFPSEDSEREIFCALLREAVQWAITDDQEKFTYF